MRGRDPRTLWLLGLLGVVAAAVALPLAMASAGQVSEAARHAMAGEPRDAVRTPGHGGGSGHGGDSGHDHAAGSRKGGAKAGAGTREGAAGAEDAAGSADAKIPSPSEATRLLGLGLDTATRCGPQLTSPDGLEAQTCVLTQGADTWARTYYRNTTGRSLDSVLSLLGPDGRSVQMHCVTGTDDEPATCETPRQHIKGGPDAYSAVNEFASRGTDGMLLLRSGSDAAHGDGNTGAKGRS
ncbi:hypothetical protein [Streptomyces alanosinicus]|uniref:Uncharacterized protein n=1 Tax=Streptomyces alanosinicus TaxID=68171 RepID=A0A918YHY7_9ACTN|nr:hypothetical protein [Streptomyces alanosinicus]GHE03683.1 hypothetical protein GCM10010339_31990 [Streptomyces alanosinicus]